MGFCRSSPSRRLHSCSDHLPAKPSTSARIVQLYQTSRRWTQGQPWLSSVHCLDMQKCPAVRPRREAAASWCHRWSGCAPRRQLVARAQRTRAAQLAACAIGACTGHTAKRHGDRLGYRATEAAPLSGENPKLRCNLNDILDLSPGSSAAFFLFCERAAFVQRARRGERVLMPRAGRRAAPG